MTILALALYVLTLYTILVQEESDLLDFRRSWFR
jgi:hypothetical protein